MPDGNSIDFSSRQGKDFEVWMECRDLRLILVSLLRRRILFARVCMERAEGCEEGGRYSGTL